MCFYSVWSEVDELAFHENTILLEALARSQAEQPHTEKPIRPDIFWARDFLDDFALIVAGPGEASNVAAACLELALDEEESITIRVAKNEDFDFEARQRLSQVVEVMNQVRQRGLSISEGEDRCFELIVRGCQSRIIKQITSPKGLWSLVHQFSMVAVDGSSKTLFAHRAQHSELRADIGMTGDYSSCTHEEYMQLAVSRWRKMAEFIDRVKECSDPDAVKVLARLAHDVRRSDTFRSLLEALLQQRQHHASRILDKVGKIAKFFRSAVTLTQVAARARLGSIKVEITPSISRSIDVLRGLTVADMVKRAPALSGKLASHAVEVRRLIRRWRKYIVHAEMLLLIFYEEHPQITLATNYIGISKRSCYLCANFIRIHDVFAVEGQHQQLYCLWTLPTKIKMGSPTQNARICKVLTELQHLLETNVATVSHPSHRPLTFLKESVANFSRATIIARVESLERLNRVSETEELMTSRLSLPPLVEDEAETRKSLKKGFSHVELCHQAGGGQIQTRYEEVNQSDCSAPGLSSPLDINVKRSSYPEVENQSPEDRYITRLQAGNRCRRPRARPCTTAGGVRRRRVSKAVIPQRPRRSATKGTIVYLRIIKWPMGQGG